MENDLRMVADRARQKLESGQALLVCAYDDEKRCRTMMFEGALTLKGLEDRLGSLPAETGILFYCA
jgi:hypothetical protein